MDYHDQLRASELSHEISEFLRGNEATKHPSWMTGVSTNALLAGYHLGLRHGQEIARENQRKRSPETTLRELIEISRSFNDFVTNGNNKEFGFMTAGQYAVFEGCHYLLDESTWLMLAAHVLNKTPGLKSASEGRFAMRGGEGTTIAHCTVEVGIDHELACQVNATSTSHFRPCMEVMIYKDWLTEEEEWRTAVLKERIPMSPVRVETTEAECWRMTDGEIFTIKVGGKNG